jgi:hypothetical protein
VAVGNRRSAENGVHAMQMTLPKSGRVLRGCSVALVGSLFLALSGSTAWASPDGRSDKRAAVEFLGHPGSFLGHPTSCSAIGFRGDTRVGSSSNLNASDVNVAGTVKTNAGPIEPGTGQEVDIAITGPPTVVVDAVVVGGRLGHHTYRGAKFLPPVLQPDQHYIPPFNFFNFFHGVQTIRYWFACYHMEPGTALPEVPQVLEVPLAGGAIFATWMIVQRRRRKSSLRHTADSHTADSHTADSHTAGS